MRSARIEQALERLSEDSTLTGDLTDPEATAVLAWAEARIMAVDDARDDNSFASQVARIRAAVRTAARSTDEALPVTERAERALGGGAAEVGGMMVAAAVEQTSEHTAVAPGEQPLSRQAIRPAAPSWRSTSQTLPRKLRRWAHRKVS